MRLNQGRILILLAAVTVLASSMSVIQVQPAEAGGRSCTGWESRKVEPNYIRVLDTKTRKVHKVPFKKYVRQVMASGEWPSRLPRALLKAGAQATKQYGWYYSLKGNWRGGRSNRKCYDVVNTTIDQLWQNWVWASKKQAKAVNAIWGLSLWKWGTRFFLTGYRAGTSRVCGSDANGWKLYAASAKNCAKRGWSSMRILKKYYSKIVIKETVTN